MRQRRGSNGLSLRDWKSCPIYDYVLRDNNESNRRPTDRENESTMILIRTFSRITLEFNKRTTKKDGRTFMRLVSISSLFPNRASRRSEEFVSSSSICSRNLHGSDLVSAFLCDPWATTLHSVPLLSYSGRESVRFSGEEAVDV